MKSFIGTDRELSRKWDAVLLGVFEKEKNPFAFLGKIDRKSKDFLEGVIRSGRFKAKEKEIFSVCLPGCTKACSVFLAGLGKRESFTLEKLRQVVGASLGQAKKYKAGSLGIELGSLRVPNVSVKEISCAIFEAVGLGLFRFNKYKSGPNGKTELRELGILCGKFDEKKEVKEGMDLGNLLAQAANWARTNAMEPANNLTPRIFAERAKELAERAGITVKVLDEEQAKELGMGGFLGVAQGSGEPPQFIVLEYLPASAKGKEPVVLVGKGITFDSGGISIKPSSGMEQMKYDMAGAAAVIAAVWFAAKMKLPVPVIGLAPACENLPSEKPQRPGDVVKMMNGKTVEVVNTDAEGRMILADALCYALRYKPRYLIDLATLTGACRNLFGEYAIGLMGNNRELVALVAKAGEMRGERCWELPLWDEYKEHLKSDVADMKNIGKGVAGAMIGGKFLEEFVKDSPWAHLDIASTAWFDENHGYISRGPSGAGVRLLAQFLTDLSK
ncbi:MAG TPA: leucyl aminopeptidase [Candidatus Omnitrophota bacterium]|nr:leucyl aminopeptidase [Candidatus Omnitrophota bacterium]